MELVETLEIDGEEREIADAYARGQIDGINSNLDNLQYSDVAGGKNLFKGDFIDIVLDSINYTDIDLIKEQNTIKSIEGFTYVTFGAYLKKGTYTFSYTNNAYFSLNRIAIAGTYCMGVTESIRKSYTWTQSIDGWTYFGIEGDDKETGTVDTPFSITPNIQIEEGTTATEYEPYIPSVKMLAEEVSAQNESLSDYGLDNKFDGVWEQGYPDESHGILNSQTAIHIKNTIPCTGGVVLNMLYDKSKYLRIAFYNASNQRIGNIASTDFSNELKAIAPSGTSYIDAWVSHDVPTTPSTSGKLKIYVGNEIDQINADLTTLTEDVKEIKNDLSKQCKKDDITTNETLIGTFNGKNYYRKLFTGISGSGGSITVNVGEKIEIYNYYGRAYTYGQSGASDVKYPIPNKNYYIDSQNASETSFQLTIPTSSDTRKVDFVIEYTKVDE